jgi:hypothetical protein
MEESQEPGAGNATARTLLRRLAEGLLERWGIRHRAAGAIDEQGVRAVPPALVCPMGRD